MESVRPTPFQSQRPDQRGQTRKRSDSLGKSGPPRAIPRTGSMEPDVRDRLARNQRPTGPPSTRASSNRSSPSSNNSVVSSDRDAAGPSVQQQHQPFSRPSRGGLRLPGYTVRPQTPSVASSKPSSDRSLSSSERSKASSNRSAADPAVQQQRQPFPRPRRGGLRLPGFSTRRRTPRAAGSTASSSRHSSRPDSIASHPRGDSAGSDARSQGTNRSGSGSREGSAGSDGRSNKSSSSGASSSKSGSSSRRGWFNR